MNTIMKGYLFRFVADRVSSSWPTMEHEASFPSEGMAIQYAEKLLMLEANTMFHTVHVYEMHEYAGHDDKHKATIELEMTRGTRRV
jgi:hypothetical protein